MQVGLGADDLWRRTSGDDEPYSVVGEANGGVFYFYFYISTDRSKVLHMCYLDVSMSIFRCFTSSSAMFHAMFSRCFNMYFWNVSTVRLDVFTCWLKDISTSILVVFQAPWLYFFKKVVLYANNSASITIKKNHFSHKKRLNGGVQLTARSVAISWASDVQSHLLFIRYVWFVVLTPFLSLIN